jgi:YD repeat-containing protein
MARRQTTPQPPHCRDDPPWTECGERGPDFGRVFARPVAGGALALSFDRAGRRHAVTYFDAHDVSAQVVIYDRRFDVLRIADGGA